MREGGKHLTMGGKNNLQEAVLEYVGGLGMMIAGGRDVQGEERFRR